MNDLFTILIILAFIISFLNKIFGQKKKQQTTRRQPDPQPKQPDWLPPWLQIDETEVKIPAEGEQEHATIEEIEQKQSSIDSQEKLKVPPEQPIILEPKMVSEKSEPTFKPEGKPLKAIDIDKKSLDWFKEKIRKFGYTERIIIIQDSILNVDLPESNFDIILAEGILHIIGLEKGISHFGISSMA